VQVQGTLHRHRRALRQREPDHGGRSDAASRRSGVCAAASLAGLTSLAHSAYAAFGLEPPHGAPIVGPGAFGTWAGMHGSSERKNPGAYLWCDPARVGASPVIGVNAQSGKANIMLLSESLGVPLNSAQAQALMDANQAMIEGGGFTASEVSFRLACMRTLGTLRNWFAVKSWRVFDESDEIGGRFVQAFMTLTVGDSDGGHHARRGRRPRGRAHQGHAPRTGEVVSRAQARCAWAPFTVTALDVKAHDSAAHVRVTVSFNADGHEPWTTAA
jgi:2-isopropylmalate synthase